MVLTVSMMSQRKSKTGLMITSRSRTFISPTGLPYKWKVGEGGGSLSVSQWRIVALSKMFIPNISSYLTWRQETLESTLVVDWVYLAPHAKLASTSQKNAYQCSILVSSTLLTRSVLSFLIRGVVIVTWIVMEQNRRKRETKKRTGSAASAS